MTIISKRYLSLSARLETVEAAIRKLQAECPHVNVERQPRFDAVRGVKTARWTACTCGDCGKKWREEHSNG